MKDLKSRLLSSAIHNFYPKERTSLSAQVKSLRGQIEILEKQATELREQLFMHAEAVDFLTAKLVETQKRLEVHEPPPVDTSSMVPVGGETIAGQESAPVGKMETIN